MARPKIKITPEMIDKAYEIYLMYPSKVLDGYMGISKKTWIRRFKQCGLAVKRFNRRTYILRREISDEQLKRLSKWMTIDIDEFTERPADQKHKRVRWEIDAQLIKIGIHTHDRTIKNIVIAPRTLAKQVAHEIIQAYKRKGFVAISDGEFKEADYNARHGTKAKAEVERITAVSYTHLTLPTN